MASPASSLEVITVAPSSGETSSGRQLLAIHGAWHGAWCWEPFLGYFAERGWTGHALSFHGHGNSPGRDQLRWTRTPRYLQDMISVARTLPSPPVVLAHSMGGLVAQHYLLHNQPLKALVLLCSVPPGTGAWGATLRTLRRHPAELALCNLQLSLYPLVNKPAIAHDLLFSKDTPVAHVQHYYPRLQDESYLAFLDMLGLNIPRPKRHPNTNVPVLVIGSTADRLFSPAEARATARAYGGEVHVVEGMGHDLMLDDGWERVADHIAQWLTHKGLV